MHQTETNGTFYSVKNAGLNFRKFPLVNGTAFSRIYANNNNPTKVYPNFRKFITGNCRSNLIFLAVFLVEWFASQKFNNFQIIWKTSWKIAIPFSPISKFWKFKVEWKTLLVRPSGRV